MRMTGVVVGVAIFSLACTAGAIDRGADRIDRAFGSFGTYDGGDMWSAGVGTEMVVGPLQENWAVLLVGQYGQASADVGDEDMDHWRVELGLKYYLLPETSFAALVGYGQFHDSGDCDLKSLRLYAKQRFLPATAPISPYALGIATIQDKSGFGDSGCGDIVSDFVFSVGGGVDFAVRDDLAFTFEFIGSVGENTSDGPINADGVSGTFGLRYYFD